MSKPIDEGIVFDKLLIDTAKRSKYVQFWIEFDMEPFRDDSDPVESMEKFTIWLNELKHVGIVPDKYGDDIVNAFKFVSWQMQEGMLPLKDPVMLILCTVTSEQTVEGDIGSTALNNSTGLWVAPNLRNLVESDGRPVVTFWLTSDDRYV